MISRSNSWYSTGFFRSRALVNWIIETRWAIERRLIISRQNNELLVKVRTASCFMRYGFIGFYYTASIIHWTYCSIVSVVTSCRKPSFIQVQTSMILHTAIAVTINEHHNVLQTAVRELQLRTITTQRFYDVTVRSTKTQL